jgi:hypothetical protein
MPQVGEELPCITAKHESEPCIERLGYRPEMVSRLRYVWLVVLMLTATPASEVVAQQKPEKPARKEPPRPEPAKPAKPAEEPRTCCRTCSKGKACGDACISRRLTCRKPPGCACDGGAN